MDRKGMHEMRREILTSAVARSNHPLNGSRISPSAGSEALNELAVWGGMFEAAGIGCVLTRIRLWACGRDHRGKRDWA